MAYDALVNGIFCSRQLGDKQVCLRLPCLCTLMGRGKNCQIDWSAIIFMKIFTEHRMFLLAQQQAQACSANPLVSGQLCAVS
jgi:hypothetical protein